jgi:hypothetical protein
MAFSLEQNANVSLSVEFALLHCSTEMFFFFLQNETSVVCANPAFKKKRISVKIS